MEMLKHTGEVAMIVLVDVECIDYSWSFDFRVSFLNNRAHESRFFNIINYAEVKRIRGQQKQNII